MTPKWLIQDTSLAQSYSAQGWWPTFLSVVHWHGMKKSNTCTRTRNIHKHIYFYLSSKKSHHPSTTHASRFFFFKRFFRTNGKSVTCLQTMQEGQCPGFVVGWRDYGVRDTMFLWQPWWDLWITGNSLNNCVLCSVWLIALLHPLKRCCNLPGSHGAASVRTW